LPAVFALPFLVFTSAPFTSCKKSVNDTITVIKHDTTVIVRTDTVNHSDTVYDITSGLVAYYNFNAGSLHDSSGYQNDIFFNNATPAADRLGRANNAYLFNGSSSYMQVHNSASLNPDNITLYAIVKVNGFYSGKCSGNQILAKGSPDDVDGFYLLRISDTTNGCTLSPPNAQSEIAYGGYGDNIPKGTASGAGNNSSAVQTGVWYKFAFTYDGITARFYVNGVLKSSVAKTVTFTDNPYDVFIGKMDDGIYPYWFNGVIDEIRIYNRALPQQAITQLVGQNN
jgi:hypothetical protein